MSNSQSDPSIVTGSSIRIALAQMTSSNDLEANLSKMRKYLEQAAKQNAQVIAFPEMAYFMGHKHEWIPTLAQYNKLLSTFSQWAKQYAIDLLPGSLREPVANEPERHYNTLPVFSSEGKLIAQYRKIFLFKAKLSDREYDEEATCVPGKDIVTVNRPWGHFGMSICFDIRFPELFRALRKHGARFQFLPAAFAVPTGKFHWHTLTKARAIENQAYFIAPGLVGKCGDGRTTFGHSVVVSPWGEVLLDMDQKEGVAVVDLPLKFLNECEDRVNVWASRREDLLPIP